MINKKEIMSIEKKCQATYGYVFRNFGICEIFFLQYIFEPQISTFRNSALFSIALVPKDKLV